MSKQRGPWWLTSFACDGQTHVVLFRIDSDREVAPLSVRVMPRRGETGITNRLHQLALDAARRHAVAARVILAEFAA